jgi:hypothetical protein
MLQHLGGFQRKRDGQAARQLRARAVWRVPALGGDKFIHLSGQIFDVHDKWQL